ncbi:MAG TPA: cobalamin-binding protein [Urbifossiella sp.]|nr:cobalamin-binding protein [Urbifossiella sp.]
MLPAATEIVGALGLTDQLVAVSHECDFPAEANARPRGTHCEIYGKGLPSAEVDRWVSDRLRAGDSLYTLDEPLLRGLAPDLILTQKLCDVCAPAYGSVAALAATLASRPRVLNLEPKSLADVFGNIRAVAAAMDHADRADAVIAGLERQVATVVRRVEGLPRPTVFVMEWAEPIFNAGHWTPELVRLAGGTPVLSAEGEYSVRVPWEALRSADPEVLVIACCGHTVERTRQDVPLLERLPGWHALRAVRGGRVYLADGSAYFSRPGPRVVDTLEILAAVTHTGVWADPGRCVEQVYRQGDDY